MIVSYGLLVSQLDSVKIYFHYCMVVNKCHLSVLSCVTASISTGYIIGLQWVPFSFLHTCPQENSNQWLTMYL